MSIFIKNDTNNKYIVFKVGNIVYSLTPQAIQKFGDDEYVEVNDALDENDGLVVVDQLEQVFSYTLDEQDTGAKWIDGKTIYRKAFVLASQPNSNQVFIPIGTIVESWVKMGGFINDGTTTLMLPVPVPDSNAAVVGIAIINSGTTLQIHAGADGAHDGGVVWIEYTKVDV